MADDAAHLFMLDTAEISVTIMAASIPAMRVLFRDMRSSARREHDQFSGPNTGGTAGLQRRDWIGRSLQVTSPPQAGRELKDDDSSSDRGILRAGSSSTVPRVDDEVTAVEYGNASASVSVSDVELCEIHMDPKR